MSMIQSSWALVGMEVRGEPRHGQVQDREVHRIQQAGQRDDRQPDPLSPAGLRGRIHSGSLLNRSDRRQATGAGALSLRFARSTVRTTPEARNGHACDRRTYRLSPGARRRGRAERRAPSLRAPQHAGPPEYPDHSRATASRPVPSRPRSRRPSRCAPTTADCRPSAGSRRRSHRCRARPSRWKSGFRQRAGTASSSASATAASAERSGTSRWPSRSRAVMRSRAPTPGMRATRPMRASDFTRRS